MCAWAHLPASDLLFYRLNKRVLCSWPSSRTSVAICVFEPHSLDPVLLIVVFGMKSGKEAYHSYRTLFLGDDERQGNRKKENGEVDAGSHRWQCFHKGL